ncbi:Hypothetical_protein [Hexamita inflata]|uniref:Hypothetical_protein n=1 Tax=Hexamita inflata TaxID=28002 RepID=A0AA86Q7M5_9EUKA|nr:Hypothetical protein HINF_LOCUS35139 [Hexamita inflata]
MNNLVASRCSNQGIRSPLPSLSFIKPINSTVSQMKTPQDTFHISTTNSNVNHIMIALQDRNTQSQQAKIQGNFWSDFNLSLSFELFYDNIQKLRISVQNDSGTIFDEDAIEIEDL